MQDLHTVEFVHIEHPTRAYEHFLHRVLFGYEPTGQPLQNLW